MALHLQNVIPLFLEKEKISASEVWGQTITIQKGERVHIVAPSGSGKTSLMHFLYGMRKDFSGSITVNGHAIAAKSPEQLAAYRRTQAAVVFQDLRLFPDQTVLENIRVKTSLEPYHSPDRIHQMLEKLGILSKADQQVQTCSYGEQQRTAIIRALQQPFDFLILDEPFSHLDEQNRQKAMSLIEQEADERSAAIILADLKEVSYYHAHKSFRL